jgi:hypothetical protein
MIKYKLAERRNGNGCRFQVSGNNWPSDYNYGEIKLVLALQKENKAA